MEKNMKKTIAALALVLSLATVGSASARGGAGYCMGYQNGPMQGQGYQQLDKATQDKLDAFFTDTQDLRKKIVMKQAEGQALMQSDNPNTEALSKVSGELFDLRTTMHAKAKAAGLNSYIGGPGMGMGMGMGMMGGRGGGRGMGMGCRF
jgi:Spy/CpxP family protein refolding chaperone